MAYPESPPLIVVVGSLNRDIVLRVERIPAPGETVLGTSTTSHRGGKGANQAVAAARLGGNVAMIGKVGADTEGSSYLRALVSEGIDVDGVVADMSVATGTATILLDDNAENTIVVMPGANGALRRTDVTAAERTLADAAVTLAQLEVPVDCVDTAARLSGGIFILNPAPAQKLDPLLLARTDMLVVNRSEVAFIAGSVETDDVGVVTAQAQSIEGPRTIIVTLGSAGALIVPGDGGAVIHVPSPSVDAVDTTGAGDAFCGALAEATARGETIENAVRWAVRVGATATTKVGAQTALPTADSVVPA